MKYNAAICGVSIYHSEELLLVTLLIGYISSIFHRQLTHSDD
ncbi:Hypothetical protein ETEE_2656 [Edwardsiella anguillarum ET080813]|uniref:Uncharacterized protein n=1 Tax=Edwardsiella anguillarum ET080813 TaxID=667120 RepID=A0A076LKX3_9GAMM|nr:Hypothetical protein ETEE_2656 [Edwardsiella anguillarum ET080813]